jgi:tetratricopeptide (TPR) repeat protein
VRALIEAHKPAEAYEAADEALKSAPETAGAYTAQGRVFYRQAQLAKAEASFRKAATLDQKYAYALEGLARVLRTVAKFKTAERLATAAYRAAPDDPDLILGWAGTLKGDEHIEALRRVVSIYDPSAVEAKRVYAHLASDTALGGRATRTLVSPYRTYELGLVNILSGVQHSRGVGLRVRFNDSYQGTLLFDTGAGGISLSPKAARKAALEALGQEGHDVRGIGDQKVGAAVQHLAHEIRIGDLILQDHPVSIFESARDSDIDGLIGSDVFSKFLVQLDWPHMKLRLNPYPGFTAPPEGAQDSADHPPAGFQRIFIAGQLLIPTLINDGPSSLFVIDSGSSANLVNAAAARDTTKVYGDSRTILRGVQGRVKEVSRADRVRLTFANFRQDNADMLAMDLSRQSSDQGMEIGGLLGMPVLRQIVLAIDYRNAAIRLEYENR